MKRLERCPVCNGERVVLVPLPKNPHDNWVECGKCKGEGVLRVDVAPTADPED